MRRAALVLALAVPLAAAADPPRAGGRIDGDDVHVEILGQPVRVGEKLELPEGFIRVEEKGTEDSQVGSFSVVPAETFGKEAPDGAVASGADFAPPAAAPAQPECRAERAAYLAELWRESGIQVSDPAALLDGLEAGQGAKTGYYWFALATDPFRPLAWSSELRSRAEALASCVKQGSARAN